MKMWRKFVIAMVLLLTVNVWNIHAQTLTAPDLSSAGYNRPINPFASGQCTWYAFGRAYEKTGVAVNCRRNAKFWYDDSSLLKGTTPQSNSIISWNWGASGHVAYVESVSGDSITITESNYNWIGFEWGKYQKTLTRSQWSSGLNGFIYLQPNPPTGLTEPFIESSRVGLDWWPVAGANAYRVQVARYGSPWNETTGFINTSNGFTSNTLPSSNSTNSIVLVNSGISTTGYTDSYTWNSGSANIYAGPPAGTYVQWTVNVNIFGQGASKYTAPRLIYIPPYSNPILTLSSSGTNRSVSQYANLSPSSFQVRNSGTGTLNYSCSSNASWMSVSPASGSSTSAWNTVNVNFNTSNLAPNTYTGYISVSGANSTQNFFVTLTVVGVTTATDDHGNTPSSASQLLQSRGMIGTIEVNGDQDWFKFYVSSAGYYNLYSTGNTDVIGELYDSSGSRLLASNDDATSNSYTSGRNFYINSYLQSGYYYIKVRGYNSTTGGYVVNFR